MSRQRLLLLPVLTLAGSCSLLVTDVQVPPCSSNDDCAVLNEINGISSTACARYQCVFGRDVCELSARDNDRDGAVAAECAGDPLAQGLPVDCDDDVFSMSVEICNGLDDDCDGVIDNVYVPMMGADPVNALPASTGQALVMGGAASGRTGYGVGGGVLAAIRTRADLTAQFGLLSGSVATRMAAVSHQRASDAALTDLQSGALADGCHLMASSAPTYTSQPCRYGEIAMGLTPDARFVATVSTQSCGAGLLRLGYFTGDLPAVIERGPLRRSNAFFGVRPDPDMTSNYACTGLRAGGVLGAARPSVGAADVSGPLDQALVAWLGDTVMRPACGGTEVDVEALAAIVEQDTMAGTPYGWVTASNDAIPQVLGRTRGGGAPGVGVWSNTGYVVGFGDAAGALSLSFVDLAMRPVPYDRTMADVPRTTAPLVITSLGTIPAMGSGPVDDVAIAIGSVRTGGIEVGVTWREGCGGGETIWFRQLFLSRSGSTVSLDMARSQAAVQLTTAPASPAGPPAITYLFDGMLAVGAARADGRPTGTAENDGGWIVAWAEGGTRVVARRVSEADGALLNDGELLVLHAADAVSMRERPALYVTDGVVHYAYYDATANQFWGGALTCAAP
ncbi:MAG: putative metal-binding motif-containing protein [Sandaracinaceae bacterium]|nr:putative metal-binding motif-containing protein [Sandaracinaceae bacterium]